MSRTIIKLSSENTLSNSCFVYGNSMYVKHYSDTKIIIIIIMKINKSLKSNAHMNKCKCERARMKLKQKQN